MTGPSFDGIILQSSGSGTWRPTRDQVVQLEHALGALVTLNLSVDGRKRELSPEALTRYKRFYVGMEKHGRRLVQVYLECKVDGWPTTTRPLAAGGGECHIQATWDLERATFTSIKANSAR